MPPYVFKDSSEGLSQPFQYFQSGIGKSSFEQHVYQPLVFQQSVTLTASIWDEKNPKENMEFWNFNNWSILSEYSPLIIGLFCGFGIVMIVMSSLVLWRYCLQSATKKVCCRGTYGSMTAQIQKSILQQREPKQENLNSFENFQSKVGTSERYPALQRSLTVSSLPVKNTCSPIVEMERKYSKLRGPEIPHLEPLMSQDLYTSHLYLQKLDQGSEDLMKNLSRSTPALEDLYSKVNFSKKIKNRMRSDDAAIIAMSKSHSGHNNNSLVLSGSAVVVYNERTAL